MRKTFQFTLLLPALTLALACGRQNDCPEFNAKVLEWVPYENNDTVRLKNSANDSIMLLVVNEIIVEHTTHYIINSDCGTCDDRVMINGSETNNTDLQISIRIHDGAVKGHSFIIMNVYFTENNSQYSEQSDYTFDNHLYEAVRIFDRTGSGEKFIKLILARNLGIVGLVDNAGNNWRLIENAIKSSESDNIEIRNISCG